MKKKTLSIALALTVAMGITLTGCGKEAESSEDKSTVTATVEEKSSETESTEVPDETESEEVEPAYITALKENPKFSYNENYVKHLEEDETFDLANAIPDMRYTTNTTDGSSRVLANAVDVDFYMNATGATATDINQLVTLNLLEKDISANLYMFPDIMYYSPAASTIRDDLSLPPFGISDKAATEPINVDNDYCISSNGEEVTFTLLRTYTVPEDTSRDTSDSTEVKSTVMGSFGGERVLCEIEYNGEHGWMLVPSDWLQ